MNMLNISLLIIWIVGTAITMIIHYKKFGWRCWIISYLSMLFAWPFILAGFLGEKKKKEMDKAKDSDIRAIARSIGYYYYDKYKDQNKQYIRHCVEMLQIHNISISSGFVNITLGRPGLLIGKRGENINALLEYMQSDKDLKHLNISTINLIESRNIDCLFAYEAMYADYSYDPACDDFEFERETLPE